MHQLLDFTKEVTMNIRIEYKTDEERQEIIEQHRDLFLVEDQNFLEGNFLVFSDKAPEPPKVFISVPEEEFESMKQRQDATDAAVLQLLMEGVM